MKKTIARQLFVIIMTVTLCTLILNSIIQVDNAKKNQIRGAQLKIEQLKGTLNNNSRNLAALKESQQEISIIRAKTAAYIIQHHTEIVNDLQELKKIAGLLQVDELHIFNEEGTIYSGTIPKYYGYNFNSGEQMQFFLPMLQDKTLVLSQDIMPNTAEKKYMQYSAVWQENGKNIIQIGMDPDRIMKAQQITELSYLFSIISNDEGEIRLAVDCEQEIISGSTDRSLTGKNLHEIGLPAQNIQVETGFFSKINNTLYYCYFEQYNSLLIGILVQEGVLYNGIFSNLLYTSIYLIIAALIILYGMFSFIDSYIIKGIDTIIDKLSLITAGNLDVKVDVNTSPEFEKLSEHINTMVHSLLNNMDKLSKIFDMANVMLGVYEFNADMKRVRATRKVQTLLMLDNEEFSRITADKILFNKYMETIFNRPYDPARNIYMITADTTSYLQILPFSDETNTVCIITDATEEVIEKQHIEHDRDYDVLTGLFNRRAFNTSMEKLFTGDKAVLTESVLLLLDMDGLKSINDTYGHINGDIAIKAAATILLNCEAEQKIAARLGGDEFVIFIYGYTRSSLQNYIQLMYQAMLNTTITLTDGSIKPLRLSGGYVFYPESNCNYGQLLEEADTALYQVKKSVKGIFLPYKEENKITE